MAKYICSVCEYVYDYDLIENSGDYEEEEDWEDYDDHLH